MHDRGDILKSGTSRKSRKSGKSGKSRKSRKSGKPQKQSVRARVASAQRVARSACYGTLVNESS